MLCACRLEEPDGTIAGAGLTGDRSSGGKQAPYASNALAALGVLYTSVSMSLHGARKPANETAGDGLAPQHELTLLAVGTLQQDILSYLRRHPQAEMVTSHEI